MTDITWSVGIDWDKDGTYTDETGRLLSLSSSRGRDQAVFTDSYDRARIGECSFILDNYDRRYDPHYTSSPLTGTILPDRPVKIQLTYDSLTRNVFNGRLSNIIPFGEDRTVQVICLDGLSSLRKQYCSLGSLQTDISVADAISTLLEDAGFPYITGELTFPFDFPGTMGSSSIEDNGDVIPYWWSDHRLTVLEAIDELSQAFMGDYYVDTAGNFVYEARSYDIVSSVTLDQSQLLRDIEVSQPWEDIRNVIRVIGHPLLSSAADSELWKLGNIPLIAAGESLTIWAEYSYEGVYCAATAITTLAATTDYTANTLENGTGTDKTAQISIVKTDYAAISKLVITNNDAAAVYLTLMKLRGTALYNLSGSLVEETDATSITAYGQNGLTVSSPWLQTTDDIQAHADWAGVLFANERKNLRVRIAQRPELQVEYDLFDYATAVSDYLGVDDIYTITDIRHDWQPETGLLTTLRLEPSALVLFPDLWVFTATFGDTLGW